jgi:hypothetical protein
MSSLKQLESKHHENRAMGMEVGPSIAFRREEMVRCRPFRKNSLKEGEVWHIDVLLSGDSINSDHVWAVASVNTYLLLGSGFLIMQQLYTSVEEMCFLCGLY